MTKVIQLKWLSLVLLFVLGTVPGFAQSFINLNFESANVSGYSQGSSNVPVSSALPGWTASFYNSTTGTTPLTQVWYDGYAATGPSVSVFGTFNFNAPWAGVLHPPQGNYYAILFGGGTNSAVLSQTGEVPAGTVSLLLDIRPNSAPYSVTLGGQTLNLQLLQSFGLYNRYGADISAFAGQVATLSFMENPGIGGQPFAFSFDDIQFSPNPIPEPGTLALLAVGSLLFGWRFGKRN